MSKVTFEEAVRRLRGICPPEGATVSVRRRKMPDEGRCAFAPGKFSISVRSGMDEEHQILILVHEWAHALAWHYAHGRSRHHDAHWGVSYAECYEAVYPAVA